MKKIRYDMVFSMLLFLALLAFSTCIAAEFKRSKSKDMKSDGKRCSLPGSPAFGLGIAASICLLAAQIIGISIIATQFCSKDEHVCINPRTRIMSITLLLLSWVSFGFAIFLLGVGTSMNKSQMYGYGWLDGECYVVKDGVYIGAALLSLAMVIFILGVTLTTRTRDHQRQEEQGRMQGKEDGR
ncbi:chitin synthase, putative (DUF1218) [Tasmannia lanceolata]|uniref:chitin synthase, putative (DUF1218) n=1 Tax=Tasmannia lanceolata TaxID=3420 RepID=UPI004063876A